MTRRRSSGFTLLEVLVALAVLGFLIAGLTQGIRFGLLAWNAQARTLASSGELHAIDRALRRLIAEMDPGGAGQKWSLRGGPDRLEFISELPASVASLPTRRAHLLLMVDPAKRLVLRWTTAMHVERVGVEPPADVAELLAGVDHLELAYWLPADDGGGWLRTWTYPHNPALVRIRIVFPKGDSRRWPDIVAAPVRDSQGVRRGKPDAPTSIDRQ